MGGCLFLSLSSFAGPFSIPRDSSIFSEKIIIIKDTVITLRALIFIEAPSLYVLHAYFSIYQNARGGVYLDPTDTEMGVEGGNPRKMRW